jgi:signal transduction histidine kinase
VTGEFPFIIPRRPRLDSTLLAAELRAVREREDLLETVVEYLRLLLESTQEGIVGVDREGRCTFVNQAAQRLLGYSAGELVGKAFLELVRVPPGGRDGDGERFRRADGTCFEAEYSTNPIVVEEDVQGAVLVFTDTGSARRAQRYLETQRAVTEVLADSSTADEAIPRILRTLGETMGWSEFAAFWELDESGSLRCRADWTLPAAEEEFGRFGELSRTTVLSPGLGLAGRAYESREPTWVSIEDALADPETFSRADAGAGLGLNCGVAFPIVAGADVLAVVELFGRTLTRPDGELLKMLDALGAPIGHFLERKRAECEADRLKDQFISLVSHELRTPLSSVLGYLELLEREDVGPLTADQRRCLATIGRNSNRLLRLVGDLLLVAQIEAGNIPLELEPVSLAGLGSDALESARPGAYDRGIDLRLEISGEPIVHGDRGRLAQVLDNLISNAIKFTEAGGHATVRVASERVRAVVEVADSGVGMPPEIGEELFRPFFRTDSARDLAIQGSGLGLAISKALVEAHGGSIRCRSAEGVGTTFTVELPLAAQRLAFVAAREAAANGR